MSPLNDLNLKRKAFGDYQMALRRKLCLTPKTALLLDQITDLLNAKRSFKDLYKKFQILTNEIKQGSPIYMPPRGTTQFSETGLSRLNTHKKQRTNQKDTSRKQENVTASVVAVYNCIV